MEFRGLSNFLEPGNEKRVLSAFLEKLQRFIAHTVETGRDEQGQNLFFEELRDPMRLAWTEMGSHFDEALEKLSIVTDEDLRKHGLYGGQLIFKVILVEFAARTWVASGGRRLFNWLLEVLDTFLKSILEAVGAGSALEEFKEAIGHSVKIDKERRNLR